MAVLTRLPLKAGSSARLIEKLVLPPGASGAVVVQVAALAAMTQRGSELEMVVPAGALSLTTTPAGTAEGPLLVTVTV